MATFRLNKRLKILLIVSIFILIFSILLKINKNTKSNKQYVDLAKFPSQNVIEIPNTNLKLTPSGTYKKISENFGLKYDEIASFPEDEDYTAWYLLDSEDVVPLKNYLFAINKGFIIRIYDTDLDPESWVLEHIGWQGTQAKKENITIMNIAGRDYYIIQTRCCGAYESQYMTRVKTTNGRYVILSISTTYYKTAHPEDSNRNYTVEEILPSLHEDN